MLVHEHYARLKIITGVYIYVVRCPFHTPSSLPSVPFPSTGEQEQLRSSLSRVGPGPSSLILTVSKPIPRAFASGLRSLIEKPTTPLHSRSHSRSTSTPTSAFPPPRLSRLQIPNCRHHRYRRAPTHRPIRAFPGAVYCSSTPAAAATATASQRFRYPITKCEAVARRHTGVLIPRRCETAG